MWGKNARAGQTTETIWHTKACDLHAGALKQEYRHTLRICNIFCFSAAKWLREHASVFRYTYIACLVNL